DFFSAGNPEKISIVPRRDPLTQEKRHQRDRRTKKTQAIKLGFESTKGGGWRRHLLIVDLVGCTASVDPMVQIISTSGARARKFALRN
ncbi:hypothetical protein Q6249_28085, partial [Klebsiella pneumoniae]|uniref:hypothetical protein n=1 Tax=Klebsiella pneumoniae TaxID=573 RepID=UPI002730815E